MGVVTGVGSVMRGSLWRRESDPWCVGPWRVWNDKTRTDEMEVVEERFQKGLCCRYVSYGLQENTVGV